MTIRVQQPDGSYVEYTEAEYVAEFGAIEEPVPLSELSRSDRAFAERMQSEADVTGACIEAGVDSIFDLPVEGDEDLELPADFKGHEYDFEGALADYNASQGRRPAQ